MTILTIDDEENIRNGLADNFELEGYDVKQAASGEEGLKIVSEGGIDLVITDLRMDGISGEEVVRQVTTKYPGIPVIENPTGLFNDDTTQAVKKIQSVFGLTSTGTVNYQTWYMLSYIFTALAKMTNSIYS